MGSGGLVLCGARWYQPTEGRWLSRDPIGYEGGANLYEYCGGDPVGGIDPSGLLGGPSAHVVVPVAEHVCRTVAPELMADAVTAGTGVAVSEAVGVSAVGWVPVAGWLIAGTVLVGHGIEAYYEYQYRRAAEAADTPYQPLGAFYHGGLPLSTGEKDKLRQGARALFRRAVEGGQRLYVHHRFPLEYAHLFHVVSDPNRSRNLCGADRTTHKSVNSEWLTFHEQHKRGVTALQVQRMVQYIDRKYGKRLHYVVK